MNQAVFLDRDGTVIELVHHLTNPDDVALIEGVGEAIKRLRAAGYVVVIVTNQSVIGRGLLTTNGLEDVHTAMNYQLAEYNTKVDAIYFCPEKPKQSDPAVVEHPMRKPGPGMLLEAARDHEIDLARSWMVGDSLSDIHAGLNAGCKTVLVRTGYGASLSGSVPAHHITADLSGAAELILKEEKTP